LETIKLLEVYYYYTCLIKKGWDLGRKRNFNP